MYLSLSPKKGENVFDTLNSVEPRFVRFDGCTTDAYV